MLVAEYIDYMDCYRLYDDDPKIRAWTIAYLEFEEIQVAEEDLQRKILIIGKKEN